MSKYLVVHRSETRIAMEMKNLLVVFMAWQLTSAQENCPSLKLSTGLGTLLGNLPFTNCAPDLPTLPSLPIGGCGIDSLLPSLPSLSYGDGIPSLPCGDNLPSLPGGDVLPSLPCGDSLPSLPSLPCGDSLPSLPCGDVLPPLSYDGGLPSLPYGDFLPSYGGGLPSLPSLPPLDVGCDFPTFEPLPYLKKKCLCGKPAPFFKYPKFPKPRCGLLKKCRYSDKCDDVGFGLKIKPLIKAFPLKNKKFLPEFGDYESLPCELPSFVSNIFRGSLGDGCL